MPQGNTPQITLYEYGPSRSRQVRWMLLELELQFDSKEGREVLHSDELNSINPMGKVPAVLIDGQPLFESAAICTYLADLRPESGLIAASGTRERALHMQWMSFALTEIEAFMWSNARNTFVLPEEQRSTALFEQNNQAACVALKVLDTHLASNDYMIANQFSATDVIVGFIVNWAAGTGLLKEFNHCQAYLERLKQRPHCTL